MRGAASSSTHCGRKPSWQTCAVRKDDEYCYVLCVVLQLSLLLLVNFNSSWVITHIALQAFCFPKCDFWGGLEGAAIKNFIGSLSLAIFSGPLINYAVIRPLVSRMSTVFEIMVETRYFQAKCVNISKSVEDSPKLLLMDNRKMHMRFRLATRSMTLDDLDLHAISSNCRRISRDFADLGANNIKTNEDRPVL